jgi:hypothetical protein
MNNRYPMITAAVAAAIAGGYATTAAAAPTVGDAAGSTYTLVVSGSSAAQSSIANAVETDLCGGASNTLVVQSNASSSANKNFYAYSCQTATAITGVPANTLITIYYRSEGGSVTGALPIASGKQIKRLNLSDPSCTSSGTAGTCTVTGVTATNGPNDSWNGAVTNDYVQVGVTDVEPGQLVAQDYPSNYAPSVFGTATTAQMVALNNSAKLAIQQVFGLAVNTSGLTLNPANNGSINLSRESVANILNGNYSDWSAVPDALTGNPISTTSAAITEIDREPGSGTRTSANIYFLGYGCSQSTTAISGSTNLNYSTGDELNAVQAKGGSFGYASIDNLLPPKNTAYPNVVLATLNGVVPSTLAAAAGEYDYWYEATLIPNSSHLAGNSLSLANWLTSDVPKFSAAPVTADIDVIPNVAGNSATVPLASRSNTSGMTIYINPYTRSKNSCSAPSETN